jgi:hypothetical protein
MVEVLDEDAAVFDTNLDVLVFQFLSVLPAKDGQQKLIPHIGLGRVPVDIEVGGELRGAAIF